METRSTVSEVKSISCLNSISHRVVTLSVSLPTEKQATTVLHRLSSSPQFDPRLLEKQRRRNNGVGGDGGDDKLRL